VTVTFSTFSPQAEKASFAKIKKQAAAKIQLPVG